MVPEMIVISTVPQLLAMDAEEQLCCVAMTNYRYLASQVISIC